MKKIHVNGTPRETVANTVEELVAELGFSKGSLLVELNGEALRPAEWAKAIEEGARVELMRIAAGG